MFSNEGRGYVLRRLLRRAERYGHVLGINHSFLYELVEVVAEIMKSYYPYLLDKKEYISKMIQAEEEERKNKDEEIRKKREEDQSKLAMSMFQQMVARMNGNIIRRVERQKQDVTGQ